ncbi:MAG: hypothetical protein AAFN74_22250, partial [Myxococcota bacterium]
MNERSLVSRPLARAFEISPNGRHDIQLRMRPPAEWPTWPQWRQQKKGAPRAAWVAARKEQANSILRR